MLPVAEYDVSYVSYSQAVHQDGVCVYHALLHEGLVTVDVKFISVLQDEDVFLGFSQSFRKSRMAYEMSELAVDRHEEFRLDK